MHDDDIYIVVSAVGPECLRDQQFMSRVLKDLIFRKQAARVVAQQDQFGFGTSSDAASSSGGMALSSELIDRFHHRAFVGSEDKVFAAWMAAYKALMGMQKRHRDKGAHVRVCYSLTADGTPRRVRLSHPRGGRVWVTYVDADGSSRVEVSAAGEALVLIVPSGGFWAATAGGAGAYDELPWEHEPLAGDAASLAFIVDTGVALASQQQMMTDLVDQLKLMASGAEPAKLPSMPALIDFDTTVSDYPEGITISLNFERKLVRQGVLRDVPGLTTAQRKARADKVAGEMGGVALPQPASPHAPLPARCPCVCAVRSHMRRAHRGGRVHALHPVEGRPDAFDE